MINVSSIGLACILQQNIDATTCRTKKYKQIENKLCNSPKKLVHINKNAKITLFFLIDSYKKYVWVYGEVLYWFTSPYPNILHFFINSSTSFTHLALSDVKLSPSEKWNG